MSMPAWRYYKAWIGELLQWIDYEEEPHPEILKTDVFNEIKELPEVGGVTRTDCPVTFVYVDNDSGYIDKFKSMYPSERAYVMDIRNLQFSPGRFSHIYDCSTIDHIPFEDVEDVIYSYHVLLKPGGILFLVSWTADTIKGNPSQYYHPRHDLEHILNEYFKVLDTEDDIIPTDGRGTLVAYTCQKE